jgi:hypothetical protein
VNTDLIQYSIDTITNFLHGEISVENITLSFLNKIDCGVHKADLNRFVGHALGE